MCFVKHCILREIILCKPQSQNLTRFTLFNTMEMARGVYIADKLMRRLNYYSK